MRELQRTEKDLWTMVYDLCVRTPEWLDLQPFQAGRLHISVMEETRDRDGFLSVIDEFKRVLSSEEIDFEKCPLLKSYPEIKNKDVYSCLKKHIEYFENHLRAGAFS